MKKIALLISSALCVSGCTAGPSDRLGLASLEKLGTVDDRYQGYNVEMVEITGGRFWAPYDNSDGERYRQRPPIDLTNPRLLALARHLGPALMRVSGTWANNTYLEAEGENLSEPPAGFVQVLTRDQWRRVVEFSKAVDAPLVTSFAVSNGARGPDGRWRPDQAQRLVDLTREAGGQIVAAELFNETNMPSAAPEMPQSYTADDYAADYVIFKDWAREALPEMTIMGPGGVGEGRPAEQRPADMTGRLSSGELASKTPNSVDAFSYHFYPIPSERCASVGIGFAQKKDALTPAWLDTTLRDYNFYAAIRDEYEPGKPIWNTETAQASCGGSPWASTFLDSFRYLDQLGALAQQGVQVVLHNTLAASDYALIDGDTLEPRPNYWAAVLWRRLMDRTVLASPASPSPDVRLYAQCLRGTSGGVALLAINIGDEGVTLPVGGEAKAWVMAGEPVDTRSVMVNGTVPSLDERGEIIGLEGAPLDGELPLGGQSIAFVAVADAANPACG